MHHIILIKIYENNKNYAIEKINEYINKYKQNLINEIDFFNILGFLKKEENYNKFHKINNQSLYERFDEKKFSYKHIKKVYKEEIFSNPILLTKNDKIKKLVNLFEKINKNNFNLNELKENFTSTDFFFLIEDFKNLKNLIESNLPDVDYKFELPSVEYGNILTPLGLIELKLNEKKENPNYIFIIDIHT